VFRPFLAAFRVILVAHEIGMEYGPVNWYWYWVMVKVRFRVRVRASVSAVRRCRKAKERDRCNNYAQITFTPRRNHSNGLHYIIVVSNL